MDELARRQLGGIDLLERDLAARRRARRRSMPSSSQRDEQRLRALVEDEHRGALAARGRGRGELRRQRRLAGAGGADDQRARALFDAAAEQRVELGDAARQLARASDVLPVLGRDQPREDLEPAALDRRSRDSRRGTSRRDT